MEANWITKHTKQPFYLRRAFTLEEKPVSAELSVCGLGQYNAFLNGGRVGDAYLEPAWTDYDKLVLFRRYDVTAGLRAGRNALALEIGSGWYIWDRRFGYSFHFPPFMPPNPNLYCAYGKSLVACFALRLRYADGSEELLKSDEACRTAPHGVKHTNVYGSEQIVGAELKPDCSQPDFDDSAWEAACLAGEEEIPKGRLEEAALPPVKALRHYCARKIGEVNGRAIYDLGQNISGILEADVRGKAGSQVDFYPAEKLDENGDADQMAKNWMPIDNVIRYEIARTGRVERVTQSFTYFAGRYIAVVGEAEILTLSATAISSAWKNAGSFSCSDERYNRIYDMIEKTVEANMLGVHTDCPTIERFAWQEPNHLMAPSVFYMKDGKALWEKFLRDLRLAQHTAADRFRDRQGQLFCPGDGLVPSQAPCYIPNVLPVPGMGSFYDIIPWGSTCILGTRWHYLFYGDIRIVRDNYETGMRYLEHLKTKINDDGFLNHGLGDWGNPENRLARENIETAFLYADAVTLAYFARRLGKTADAQGLAAFAEAVKNIYNKKLLGFDEKRGVWCYHVWGEGTLATQAAEALPLYWDMVPVEHEADVVKVFRMVLEEKGCFVAGEIGLPYVIQTARKHGMNDLVCRFITRETHPSYYAFVLDGETTLGEYWESNPRSHCHDMMGHIIEWYYNGLAGIQPLEPGFRRLRIDPYLPEGMNQFVCTYETPLGTVRVTAERIGGQARFTAEIPPKISAQAAQNVMFTKQRKVKMPVYASFHDLQGELNASYRNTGKRLQFREAIEALQKKNRLYPSPPASAVPDPFKMRELGFENYLETLYFPVPPTVASLDRMEERAMFPVQLDVFAFRHPRLTRPELHSHDFWEIECVVRGSCVFHFEDERRTLTEGAVSLIAPGSRHDIEITDDSVVCTIMLRRSSFEAAFFSLLCRDDALASFFRTNLKADQGPNYLMFQGRLSSEIEISLWYVLAECFRNDVYSNTCCISYVNLLFAALLRSAGDSPQFYRYQAGADFSQILHAIRHHCRTLTLTELAEEFHYSKPHLCTLIKQNTGVSFTELIKQIRMSRAMEFLLNTELPIFEIAEIVGYHSTDHFSRVFRSSFNCSPQEYRKTHIKSGDRFVPFEIQTQQ